MHGKAQLKFELANDQNEQALPYENSAHSASLNALDAIIMCDICTPKSFL